MVLPDGREGKYLLPLLMEESRLLADYGPEHPAVAAVRERIRTVQEYLEQHPPPVPPVAGPTPAPPPPPAQAPSAAPIPRGGDTKIEIFPVTVMLPPRPECPAAREGDERRAGPAREADGKAMRPAAMAPPRPAAQDPGRAQALAPGRKEQAEGHPRAPGAAGAEGCSPAGAPAAYQSAGAGPPAVAPAGSRPGWVARYVPGISRLQLLGAGLCLAGLLAHVATLLSFLRWYGRRLARRIREEFGARAAAEVAPPEQMSPAPGPGTQPGHRVTTTASAAARARPGRGVDCPGLDLAGGGAISGSAPAGVGLEDALLRQVFEDNLRLREQLEQPAA